MEIREVKQSEFGELLTLMNTAFSFEKEEEKFEHILPKLYNCPFICKKNRHFGAYEEGKLVASVGLYPITLNYMGRELEIACLGGVSTHPDFRLKGHFQTLIPYLIEEAKSEGYAMLYLSGDRFRYKRYGFEMGGKEAILSFSKREAKFLLEDTLELAPMEQRDVKECLALYKKEVMTASRDEDAFLYFLQSWNGVPYTIKDKNSIIGYISKIGESDVQECVYLKEYENQVLKTLVKDTNFVKIHLPMSRVDEGLLGKVNSVSVTFAEQYNVLDFEKLKTFLGYHGEAKYENNLERTRKLLGSPLGDSILGNANFYIYPADRG